MAPPGPPPPGGSLSGIPPRHRRRHGGEEAAGSEVLFTSDVPKDPLDEAGRSSLGGLQGCMQHYKDTMWQKEKS